MLKENLPGGWKAIIQGIYKGIQRHLGPITPPETKSRSELRARLVELALTILVKQTREYWSTRLPALTERIGELLQTEMPWAPWWIRILSTYATDLRSQLRG
jgi:hypothetical protein